MANILLQFRIDAKTGEEQLAKLREALDAVGVSETKVGEQLAAADREFNKLIARLNPVEAASRKAAEGANVLAAGYERGRLTADQYTAELAKLGSQLDRTSASAGGGGLLGSLNSLKTGFAALAGLAVVREGLSAFADVIRGSAEMEQAEKRLAAMVRATGTAAGYTAGELEDLADRYGLLLGVSHENVMQAESLLLSFRNVRRDAFEPTMQAAADMAAAMGTDLTSAVQTLGRALEDPSAGMDRLRRSNIILSDAAKDSIKALQDQGDLLGAQRGLLAEIEARYGGTAKAMSETFTVAVANLGNEWKRVKDEAGAFLTQNEAGKGGLSDLSTLLHQAAVELKGLREEGHTLTTLPVWVQAILGAVPAGGALLGGAQAVGSGARSAREQAAALAAAAAGKPLPPTATLAADQYAYLLEPDAVSKGSGQVLDAAKIYAAFAESVKKADERIKEFMRSMREGEKLPQYGENLFSIGVLAHNVEEGAKGLGAKAGRYYTDAFLDSWSNPSTGRAFTLRSEQLDPFVTYAGEHFGLTIAYPIQTSVEDAVKAGLEGGIVTGVKLPEAETSKLGSDAAKLFGESFSDGFLAVMNGDDFAKGWEGLWGGLAGMASSALGMMMTSILSGTGAQGNEKTGLQGAGIMTGGGAVNWGGVAMLGGGMLASYGAQRGNRGAAALGGALSGGVAGGMISGAGAGSMGGWNWVGAIIGAVVGGLLGYFSSGGPSKFGYEIDLGQRSNAGVPSVLMGGGTNATQEGEMGRQLQSRFDQITGSFRSMLDLMGVKLDKLPVILGRWEGETADLNATFQAILRGELPRTILAAYAPALTGGLTGLGVSGGRAASELARLQTGDFDTALAKLQAYISAVVRLRDLHEELGKSLEELSDELTRNTRDAWKATVDDVTEQLGKLTDGLDRLTSDEQVARAQQLADLVEQQYQNNRAYLQELIQTQESVRASFETTFLGFKEQTAQEQGPEAQRAFYYGQLQDLRGQLSTAGSAEEVQRITEAMLRFGQALWSLGGTVGGGMYDSGTSSREWVESFLKEQQGIADQLLKNWQDEVKASNEALRASLDALTAALTGENVLGDSTSKTLQEELLQRTEVNRSLGRSKEALDQLTYAAGELASQFSGWVPKTGEGGRYG